MRQVMDRITGEMCVCVCVCVCVCGRSGTGTAMNVRTPKMRVETREKHQRRETHVSEMQEA